MEILGSLIKSDLNFNLIGHFINLQNWCFRLVICHFFFQLLLLIATLGKILEPLEKTWLRINWELLMLLEVKLLEITVWTAANSAKFWLVWWLVTNISVKISIAGESIILSNRNLSLRPQYSREEIFLSKNDWRKVLILTGTTNLSTNLNSLPHLFLFEGSMIRCLKKILWLLVLHVGTSVVNFNFTVNWELELIISGSLDTTTAQHILINCLLRLAWLKWRHESTHLYSFKL